MAGCQLVPQSLKTEIGAPEILAEIIWNWSWDSHCNAFDIFSHPPIFHVIWMI